MLMPLIYDVLRFFVPTPAIPPTVPIRPPAPFSPGRDIIEDPRPEVPAPVRIHRTVEYRLELNYDREVDGTISTFASVSKNGERHRGMAAQNAKDKYDREFGEKLAIRRALEASGFDKSERRTIWQSYRLQNTAR